MDRNPTADSGSLAVVTAAAGPVPPAFFATLAAATARPARVVVVDTGRAGPVPAGVASVRLGEDPGRAAALNRGVAGLPSDVEWVAVADPGLRWGAGCLDALLVAADRHPRAGALGPALRRADGSPAVCAGEQPGRGDLLRGRVRVGAPRSTGPVGWVSGRCLLLRRAAWESVDGFDPRYLGPVDAVDLGARLARAGWLVLHVPGACAVVGPAPDPLEPERRGLRRYGADRHPALSRIAALRRPTRADTERTED